MSTNWYQTESTPFDKVFKNTQIVTISSMNKSKDDIASQPPTQPMAIQKVGLTRSNIPYEIQHPLGEGRITVNAKIEMYTQVPATVRGVHMSRINNIIATSSLESLNSLVDYSDFLVKNLRDTHYQGRTEASIQASLPLYSKLVDWQDRTKISLDQVILHVRSLYENGKTTHFAGMEFTHITACPCVQKTFIHANNLHDIEIPLLTHSQRSNTKAILTLTSDIPSSFYSNLLNAIDRVVHRTSNTLPREFELHKVYSSHLRPQFIEDVVRDLAHEFSKTFVRGEISNVVIDASSNESIHDFDIDAHLEFPLHDRPDI